MTLLNKIEKFFVFIFTRGLSFYSPSLSTKFQIYFYRRWGMKIAFPPPNYISSTVWFDGSDYSRIKLGEGCTISTHTSFLTHDWALHTIGKSLGVEKNPPLGIHKEIIIHDFVFVGRGVILLPGAEIGRGAIIGAGSVVRGKIPNYSIVIGNPGKIIGDSREYFSKKTGLHIA